jgi:hypothetical protein
VRRNISRAITSVKAEQQRDFTVDADDCEQRTLEAGEKCSIDVALTGTLARGEARRISIVVGQRDGETETMTVTARK